MKMTLPLSLLCFYDASIQHGVEGLKALVKKVKLILPQNRDEEILWIKEFNEKRLEELQSKSYWHDSIYRVHTLNDLIESKKYNLDIGTLIIKDWDNEEFLLH